MSDNAKYAVEFYLRGDDRYKMVEYLPDMGKEDRKEEGWGGGGVCGGGWDNDLLSLYP